MTKEQLLQSLEDSGFPKKIRRAFERVDRELFVPEDQKKFAWEDTALPIGFGQTISQPQTIASMLLWLNLQDGQKALEVGCGSGYVLALLAEIVKNGEIYGTEIVRELSELSKKRLTSTDNVAVFYTPDTLGLAERAPFDRILVSAAAEKLPEKLLAQLKDEGVMVCPVGNSIIRAEKKGDKIKIQEFPGFAFVPLMTES